MPKRKRTRAKPEYHGKAVAKTAKVTKPGDKFIGRLKGIIKIVGDIESPIQPPEAWQYD
ncbi:MAG TPA: hypothetical protein VFF64_20880 [Candidatus Eremiobacteraceae bacterium]|nr:hypothetical protein [Candidatus Eremiobacteraceae bacterium]